MFVCCPSCGKLCDVPEVSTCIRCSKCKLTISLRLDADSAEDVSWEDHAIDPCEDKFGTFQNDLKDIMGEKE